ncbi:hypothetical protein KDL45_04820 [bacterium]|nr:hypothetical protein [bacterium]
MARRFPRIGIHALIVLAILAAAEIALRALEPSPPEEEELSAELEVSFDHLYELQKDENGVPIYRSVYTSRFEPDTVPPISIRGKEHQSAEEAARIREGLAPFLSFTPKPAPGVHRIVVLGSSPVWGTFSADPNDNTLLVWHLRDRLEKAYPGEKFELINAAHIAFGGPEVVKAAREMAKYNADLALVYYGGVMPQIGKDIVDFDLLTKSKLKFHVLNFVLKFKLAQLVRDVMRMESQPELPRGDFDENRPEEFGELLPPGEIQSGMNSEKIVASEEGLPLFAPGSNRLVQPQTYNERTVNLVNNLVDATNHDYRLTFQAVARPFLDRDVPLVFYTVATNVAAIPPFWSMHWTPLSDEQLKQFEELYKRGRQAMADGRYEDALEPLKAAIAVSDTFADALFLYAQALENTGRRGEAREYYHRAKEYDASNERALDRPNEILEEVAKSIDAPVIDSNEIIAAVDPDGIIGSNLFVDHQHPNGIALQALADATVPVIGRVFGLKPAIDPSADGASPTP